MTSLRVPRCRGVDCEEFTHRCKALPVNARSLRTAQPSRVSTEISLRGYVRPCELRMVPS